MVIFRADDKIKWVYGLQDPINLWLDRWYVNDAGGCVYAEHTSDGLIHITIPTVGRYGLEKGLTDNMFKEMIPLGQWGIVDCDTSRLLFSSKKGWTPDLWGHAPRFMKRDIDDFRAYLAGDVSGKFLACYGTTRSVAQALFVQSHTYGLRTDRPQTYYGRQLAAGLILKRYGLPQISELYGVLDKDLMHKKSEEVIPDECFTELHKLDTSPVVTVTPSTSAASGAILTPSQMSFPKIGPPDITPSDSQEQVSLEYVMDVGLNGLEPFNFPLKIDFTKYVEGTNILHGLKDLFFEDKDTIVAMVTTYIRETAEMLESLLHDYDIHIVAPGSVTYISPSSDEEVFQ